MYREPRDDIADLEAEIDRLADTVERCRKVMIFANALILAGSIVVILGLLGLTGATNFVLAIAAVLAGIAAKGSHRRTRTDASEKIKGLDVERSQIIDQLHPRSTGEATGVKPLAQKQWAPPELAPTALSAVSIEQETAEHWKAIDALTRVAFRGDYEADLAERLRHDGLVIGAFVALDDNKVIGHIMLSELPTEVDGRRVKAACLAPMSVSALHRQQGIGARIIETGIAAVRERGYEAVFVLGDPSYYTRFGFSSTKAKIITSPFSGEAFMALELVPGALSGKKGAVKYPRAFQLDA
jgi:putative acetyltransferase